MPPALEETVRRAVEEAIEATGGNMVLAARRLGIPIRTLYRKVHRLRLDDFVTETRKRQGKPNNAQEQEQGR